MTTVINNPGETSDSGNGIAMMIGIFLIVGVAILFFVYGMPAIRSNTNTPSVVPVPQVEIPKKIDVNVQPK